MRTHRLIGLVVLLASCSIGAGAPVPAPATQPTFADVTVHDPDILREGDTFYIVGSHLGAAKSNDLMHWTLIDEGVHAGHKLIPDVTTQMKEALAWGQTRTFWAGSLVKLGDGRFAYYYSVCKGDSPRGAIGLALAQKPDGPYKHEAIIVKSGMWGQPGADGTIYDAVKHPNAVDPHTFFDATGQLWMTYGSYSGGIFIMKMNPATGLPTEGQGWGRKLLGGNHSRIEAPYVLYNPQTKFYYLFLSFGGLDSRGGYQMRIARSKTPDGPFLSPGGRDMIDCHGPDRSFFDDRAIEPFGEKLLGNFELGEGERRWGYASPGHNCAYYDADTGRSFVIFHTRFPGKGEFHQVRVHQLFFNTDGWPVMAPLRYAGETIGKSTKADLAGEYQFLNHGHSITPDIVQPKHITLKADGTITGDVTGRWMLSNEHDVSLTIDNTTFAGVTLKQWDESKQKWVQTFTAEHAGVCVWGVGMN
ncbi:MAG: glycoside hydrolase family 43 protein [Tepidisphaeraceae bacterium]